MPSPASASTGRIPVTRWNSARTTSSGAGTMSNRIATRDTFDDSPTRTALPRLPVRPAVCSGAGCVGLLRRCLRRSGIDGCRRACSGRECGAEHEQPRAPALPPGYARANRRE